MAKEWVNWSGSLRSHPHRAVVPRDEDELVAAVRRAAGEGRHVRAVGAMHSSSGIIQADDVLVSLERLTGLTGSDRDAGEATLRPGTLIGDAGKALREAGLALHTVGDIDTQSIAGAAAPAPTAPAGGWATWPPCWSAAGW